ncbi:hypothetical protein IE81DRAFT_293781 [Ceraceosorus guamensis]|uniref:HD/PDEase domain-containing protein n=1 Tax=Ceraceosorus guamensis TaxID=1522189 RepID=A0A316VRH5_9BASI|nr:hypothetical protein IE81DRAFT_293781 [Ceraceosorus guamensis]PWN40197.1 hypothetical protein IE81DRAFT_293781 [Ceraceosorus guamensis]
MISAAEDLVKSHFAKLRVDPSHDWHHVHRVRQMSIWLSRCPSLPSQPDMITLELAALFHDMADAKYDPTASARTLLSPFLSRYPQILEEEQVNLIIRIVENVSWSKDQKRRAERQKREAAGLEETAEERERTKWEESCSELACVSDADRLDAIGSMGILRVAAFSGAKDRPLHIPPANPAGDSVPPAEQGEGYNSSAIAHFHDKLLKLRGERLRTETAKQEAERRQMMMKSFLDELDLEWQIADQGAQLAILEG